MLVTDYVFKSNELVEQTVKRKVKHAKFTKEEIDYLQENYKKLSQKEIAFDLARSVKSVESQLRKLDLKKTPDWTDEQTQFLIINHKTLSLKKLAKKINKSENAVKIKKTRLGLCKKK